MSNSVKHKKQSQIPDDPDATKIRTQSDWNDEHVFSGGAHGALLLRDTGQSDGVNWSALGTPSGGVASPSLVNLTITGLACFGVRGSQTLPSSLNGNIFMRGSDPEIDFENTNAPDAVRRWSGCFVNAIGDFELANAYDTNWGNVQTYLIVHSPSTDTNAYGVHSYLPLSAVGFKSLGGSQANFNAAYEWILNGTHGNWELVGGNTYWMLESVLPGINDAAPFVFTRSGPATLTDLWLGAGISWGNSVLHPSTITGGGSPPRDTGLFRTAAGTLAIGNGTPNDGSGTLAASSLLIAQYYEGTEMSAPAAPGADKGRLYFEDNGSGKTRLVVKFSSGAAQVIATQP